MEKTARKIIKSEIVLAGDVGGTKTRLGLFEGTRSRLRLLFEKIYLSKNYKGLENILGDFLRGKTGHCYCLFWRCRTRHPGSRHRHESSMVDRHSIASKNAAYQKGGGDQ